jgi:hypothetical protein
MIGIRGERLTQMLQPNQLLNYQSDRQGVKRKSLLGPSRQILPRNLMSAFGVLRTSCEADTKQIGSE